MAVIKLTSENFENEVMKTEKTVLIDFWAEWCGPCRMQSPIIDDLENCMKEEMKVCKVNVDEESELASKYNIMSIPTLIIIKNGQIINKAVGLHSKEEILEMIK